MFCNVIGGKEMPVYEYECQACDEVFEVQQKIADDPLSNCPKCHGPVKKLMSMSSFQLKGGGWYADGYSSAANGAKAPDAAAKAAASPAATTPCQSGGTCAACPASTSAEI
jgi:putative FmdB family regulatory protein